MSHSPPSLLSMRGMTKRFPGVVALGGVDLELAAGEILALMGENGAGKSTLMKILGGALRPDEGELRLEGRPVAFSGIADAKRAGIVLIPQELMPVRNLDLAGNIYLGQEPRRLGPFGLLDRPAMNAGAARLLARVGLGLSPTLKMASLTTGQAQLVEVAKALAQDARVLVMDEPTSSLAHGEVQHLFGIIRSLRDAGVGIIYISHRLDEVFEVADRITVLRDGRNVGDLDPRTASHDVIVAMMVGRPLTTWFPPKTPPSTVEVALEVRDVVVPGAREGVRFEARRGEVLGFAGLVGSGRTELMEVLAGMTPPLGGEMRLFDRPYAPRCPGAAIRRGVYLVPEDRKRHGVVQPMSIAQNISLPDIGNYRPRWRLPRRTERDVARAEVARLGIKAPSIHREVATLSGGNQQKVVLGKWLAMKPSVLLLDEPTRGIDVGARAEIYRHIAALAAEGIAIVMVSSDLEEVLGMSDRVAVMHGRRLRAVLTRSEATQERIAGLMTGGGLAV